MNHPNAAVTVVVTALTAQLVAQLHSHNIVDLSTQQQGWVVGGSCAIVLFIGRRGVKGALAGVLHGLGKVWRGKPTPRTTATKP
jgi:proteasome assembly chaperone (PAC2) family protein